MYKNFIYASKHCNTNALRAQEKHTPQIPPPVAIRGSPKRRVRPPVAGSTTAESAFSKRVHGRFQERSRGHVQTRSTATYASSNCEFDACASFSADDSFVQAMSSTENTDACLPRKYLPGSAAAAEANGIILLESLPKAAPCFNARSATPLGARSPTPKEGTTDIQREDSWKDAVLLELEGSSAQWASELSDEGSQQLNEVGFGRQTGRERRIAGNISRLLRVGDAESQGSTSASGRWWRGPANARTMPVVPVMDAEEANHLAATSPLLSSTGRNPAAVAPEPENQVAPAQATSPGARPISPAQGVKEKQNKSKLKEWKRTAVEMYTEVNRLANRRLLSRIHAIDRRYLQSMARMRLPGAIFADKNGEGRISECATPARSSLGGNETENKRGEVFESLEHEVQERPLEYTIVRWSSQRPEYPATDLAKTTGGGRWETAPLHVRNEYVVFEVRGGHARTVTSMLITLPGTDSGPRQCRVFYSSNSADGPWREAWRFEIKSKDEQVFKAVHDYTAHTDEFRDLLEKQCGCIEDAWHLLLDVNGDGRLSYIEFAAAINRLKQLPGAMKSKCHFFEDIQRLFESLDVDMSGTVGLDDLQRKDHRMPEATYWKLSVTNNWGSTLTTAIAAPLTLMTVVDEQIGGVSNLMGRLSVSANHRDETDLTTAFQLETLEVSSDTIMLRNLATEYNLPLNTIEDIYSKFGQVDSDGSGKIERPEFDSMILRLHGAKEASDMPQGRLKFFWQQADKDGSGCIDFEEFLLWFCRYFATDDNSENKMNPENIVGTFYAGFCGVTKNRGSVMTRRESTLDRRRSTMSHARIQERSTLRHLDLLQQEKEKAGGEALARVFE